MFLTVQGATTFESVTRIIFREFPYLSTSFVLLFQYTQKINKYTDNAVTHLAVMIISYHCDIKKFKRLRRLLLHKQT
jgi:hypothetical protein